MQITSKVYVLADTQSLITRCEGQYSLPSDLTGWTLIDEGAPCDRLNLAQTHYFPDGLYTSDFIPRYKLVGTTPVLRSDDEIAADRAALPAPPPSDAEKIAELQAELDALLGMEV